MIFLEYYIFCFVLFFLRIRLPPRSTQSRSSAASDVYKRQFKLRDEMMKRGQDWIDLDPGDYEYEYGRADAYNEEIEEIIEECAGGVAELIKKDGAMEGTGGLPCLLYTSPSPRDS